MIIIQEVGVELKNSASYTLPVILAGGLGERLWPLSRATCPKQFLSLIGEHTLLQQTLLRIPKLPSFLPPIIICQNEHRFIVAEQLQQIDYHVDTILLEPCPKNTAPAIALAAHYAMEKFGSINLLIIPADHWIEDATCFNIAFEQAAEYAQQNYLITFGIQPRTPETGFGYIKLGAPLFQHPSSSVYHIDAFMEKPNLEMATQYLSDGSYLWNSGMFVFRADQYLHELKEVADELYEQTKTAMQLAKIEMDFLRPDEQHFKQCLSISIDYLIMMRTKRGAVIPLNINWQDLGSWNALWQTGAKNAEGNVIQGEVITEDTKDSLIYSTGRLVATLGVENLVVVNTPDAVLIAHQDQTQNLKSLLSTLKSKSLSEAVTHQRVLRPWGWYEVLVSCEHFQVKRISVGVGKGLSLQMHYHRSEHWVVVRGSARVICGEETLFLTKNQSTYIPIETKHRLENIGEETLVVIEVQSGDYLGEDDIVRFEDRYGRVSHTDPLQT